MQQQIISWKASSRSPIRWIPYPFYEPEDSLQYSQVLPQHSALNQDRFETIPIYAATFSPRHSRLYLDVAANT
jgi:hypothetical protein